MRQFKIEKAVRKAVPLLIGLMGPSGGGKTYSALRLAKGIQKVFPGDIIGIDTEANRMKHYSDKFDFHHVPFEAPHGSSDYLEVLEFARKKKPSVIIIDSMSHEHEGTGGMLDLHEKVLDRMAGNDYKKRAAMQMLAWSEPKQERRKLINGLLQMNANFIFCFRANESSRPVKKDNKMVVENFGFMPIAGKEFVYEMTINMLLLPHANGVPTWQTDCKGEKMMMKLPEQFKSIFSSGNVQLTEQIGEKLAQWAKGDGVAPVKTTKFGPCPELIKLEKFHGEGIVDREIIMNGHPVSLLAKVNGGIDYIKSCDNFGKSDKGYNSILEVIRHLEEKPEQSAQSDDKDLFN